MNTIRYATSRDIPVTHECDVVVVGGGPGGIGAAIMAARCGAKTLLVERYGFLGGMAASGEVHPFMKNHVDGAPLDRPVYTDWIEKMSAVWPQEELGLMISKDAAMLAAEDLCVEAGVQLLYHHTLVDALRNGRRITEAVFSSKSGFSAVRAKVFIDCTGDADLAALSGCEYEQGGPAGHSQPMTTCFKLCCVDRSRAPNMGDLSDIYAAAKARGELSCPRDWVLFFSWLEDDVVHFNTTRILRRSGTSGAELSDAEIEGRRQVREYIRFLRKHVPGYENARLHSMAHHVGVRETRRVRGIEYLTEPAFLECRKCPDAIARVRYSIDIHSPDGGGTRLVHMPEGEWYEVPYGCIVPKDVDNLLVGGRPVSADHAIHSSLRVMPVACSLGQAAGLAAAVAAARACKPADLDGVEIRGLLKEKGARL